MLWVKSLRVPKFLGGSAERWMSGTSPSCISSPGLTWRFTATPSAYIGVDRMKITSPVLFGDTLRAEAEVVELRPTKHPERFLFVYQNKAYNQRDQPVIEYQTTMLVVQKG